MIPSLAKGGAERVVSILSKEFSKVYDVEVMVKNRKLGMSYDYCGNLIDLEKPVSNNLLVRLYGFISNCVKVIKIKKNNNYDVSISFLEEMNIINVLTSQKVKTVLSIRVYLSILFQRNSLVNMLYVMFIKWFYNKSDFVVAQTQLVKHDLITNFNISKKKVFIIPNPFDLNQITEHSKLSINKKYQIYNEYPVITNIGRLYQQKAQWHLIRLFSQVKEEIHNARLFIIGNGELADDLVSLTKKFGLNVFLFGKDKSNQNADVFFWGQQDNPFDLLSKSDLYLHTSLFEGFPNVLVEAMACGVPIISSDCKSGPREILAPDTNYLVQTEKPEFAKYGVLMPVFDGQINKIYNTDLDAIEMTWADTVIKLLKNQEMRDYYSLRAKERSKDYAVKSVVNAWKNMLEKLR